MQMSAVLIKLITLSGPQFWQLQPLLLRLEVLW